MVDVHTQLTVLTSPENHCRLWLDTQAHAWHPHVDGWVGSACIWLFVAQYNAATTRYTQRCSYSAIPYSALYRLPYNTAVLIKFTWTTKHTSNPVAHMPCRVSMERETARKGGVVKVMEGVSVVFACLYWLSTINTHSLLSGLLQ